MPTPHVVKGSVVAEASESVVDQIYEKLKVMCMQYRLMPGERINEGELAKSFGASRTPLREALARLQAEGLVSSVPGKGFFCRRLDVQEVFSLFELRKAIESEALSLAVERASDEDIDALLNFLESTGPEPGGRSREELLELDEHYHEELMRLSGNAEMLRVLQNVNARIRFVRWVDMERRDRSQSQKVHREVLLALKARDAQRCKNLMSSHIDRRREDIAAALKEGFAQLLQLN